MSAAANEYELARQLDGQEKANGALVGPRSKTAFGRQKTLPADDHLAAVMGKIEGMC